MPEAYQPNGTVIQLWHGTPIKELFLDSKEPIKIKIFIITEQENIINGNTNHMSY